MIEEITNISNRQEYIFVEKRWHYLINKDYEEFKKHTKEANILATLLDNYERKKELIKNKMYNFLIQEINGDMQNKQI